jgi:hypothetical protein
MNMYKVEAKPDENRDIVATYHVVVMASEGSWRRFSNVSRTHAETRARLRHFDVPRYVRH